MSKYTPPKISEMTREDFAKLSKAVGLPGLPYPMAHTTEVDGKLEIAMGGIEDIAEPLALISPHLSLQDVNRIMFTQMATQEMLELSHHVIRATRPDVDNHLTMVLGEPSTGKTHELRKIFGITHPEGAMLVDCGGMDVGELIWRSTIDYGEGVREQLDERAAKGTINPKSVETLKREFAGSIAEKNGKVEINWNAVGEPRTDGADGKAESQEEAIKRAETVLKHIYEVYEGLSVRENAFGFKYVPGALLESFESGRPIILDEITKAKQESLDKLLGTLEFAAGLTDQWSTTNPMVEQGAGGDNVFVMKREDVRCGWAVGMSGNEAKDGKSTFRLSESLLSRVKPFYVRQPSLQGWESRICQILTGFPISMFYQLVQKSADAHPEKFAKLINDISIAGMTPEQIKMRPAHHEYYLKNFAATMDAASRIARIVHLCGELSDPESALVRDDKRWQKCADELMSDEAHKLKITSRDVSKYLEDALMPLAKVSAKENLSLEFDINAVFNNFNPQNLFNSSPTWHVMGERLSDQIITAILGATKGMPLTRAALIDECKDLGIMSHVLKEAKPSKSAKSLSDLLSYDPLKDKGIGNTAQAQVVVTALQAMLKQINPDIQLDASTISLENVATAVQAVENRMAEQGYAFALLNDDLDTVQQSPVVAAYSVPLYSLDDVENYVGGAAETVTLTSLLSSLAVPGQSQQTLERLWPRDMQLSTESGQMSEKDRAVLGILSGNSSDGLEFAATQALGDNGKEVSIYMLNDRQRNQVLIIGQEEIPLALKSSLAKNGISYHLLNEHKTYEHVDNFIFEGEKHRQGQASNREEKTTLMIQALMTVVGIPEKSIEADMTFGRVMEENRTPNPQFFSRVVKPRTP